jgi:hypothetical protein
MTTHDQNPLMPEAPKFVRDYSSVNQEVEARQVVGKALNIFEQWEKKHTGTHQNHLRERQEPNTHTMLNEMVVHTQNTLLEGIRRDQQLFEAVQTKPIENPINNQQGVAVGNFAVFPVRNAQDKTRYTVAETTTGQAVYENLFLSANAESICRLLNRKYSRYSPEVKQVLDLDESYVKHYRDAVHAQKKSKQNAHDQILETKFQTAKERALEIKEKSEFLLQQLKQRMI